MKYKDDKNRILHQMDVVRKHHTYLNRIEGLLKLV